MIRIVGMPHFAIVSRGLYPPRASMVIYCTPSLIVTFDSVDVFADGELAQPEY